MKFPISDPDHIGLRRYQFGKSPRTLACGSPPVAPICLSACPLGAMPAVGTPEPSRAAVCRSAPIGRPKSRSGPLCAASLSRCRAMGRYHWPEATSSLFRKLHSVSFAGLLCLAEKLIGQRRRRCVFGPVESRDQSSQISTTSLQHRLKRLVYQRIVPILHKQDVASRGRSVVRSTATSNLPTLPP